MRFEIARLRQPALALTVAALALLVGSPAGAQEIAHSQFFPILARTAGAGGTQWVTDLTIHNLTDSTLQVGCQFLEADKANIFNPSFPTRFTLAPRETKIYTDVLNTLFGHTTDIKGAVLVTVDPSLIGGNPEGAEVLATTRTYNVGDPAGTFGQTVPALSRTINASATTSVVTGCVNSARFRSNLGIMNMSLLTSLRVNYRVLDASGDTVAEGMKTLNPASVSQWSFQQLGVPKQDGPLTVELWMHPDDVLPDPCATNFPNMFIAYVSKVDGNPDGTGDAEFIYAAPNDPYSCQ
ncbi:MAG: hypothetical protein MUC56_06135 [Thermoanaerobaculales bacterium]|jgi:hypothetical protein|nr:hypothetical protein [Thermoanaerobaculales bacterium]